MIQVSHDPRQCLAALARTAGPVVVDLETTGLDRWNQIVSAGLLVGENAYVLFARSSHVSVRNLPMAEFRAALQPLERTDLIVIAHNALFDLGFLLREGIRVGISHVTESFLIRAGLVVKDDHARRQLTQAGRDHARSIEGK